MLFATSSRRESKNSRLPSAGSADVLFPALYFAVLQGNGTGHESVAVAIQGVNVTRMTQVGFDLLPEPGDVNIDGARKDHGVISPNCVEEFLARDRGSHVLNEVSQQLEF